MALFLRALIRLTRTNPRTRMTDPTCCGESASCGNAVNTFHSANCRWRTTLPRAATVQFDAFQAPRLSLAPARVAAAHCLIRCAVRTHPNRGAKMKLMRYSRKHEPTALARLGILVGHDLVADLRAGYALCLLEETNNPKGRELAAVYMPPYVAQFLHMGEAAWLALGDAYTYLVDLAQSAPDATGLNNEPLFIPLAECRLYAPLRPSKLIAVGSNYPGYGKNPGKQGGKVPAISIKTLSSIIGQGRDILKPPVCRELDFETELAVVIGKKCKHVREEDAYSVVAGYTIINDIMARD